MRNFKILSLAILIGFTSIFTVKAMDDARLMRFPDINKNLVAFVYAGDIWTVDANGGDAKRLTSHKGLELFPKISPDGQWIAFSAEYSGSRQVYIMPATGGTPEQLTWYNDVGVMPPRGGYDNVVLDWSPDSKKILVRMNRTPYGERNGRYYFVNIDGGLEQPLEITEGGLGCLSPDASQMCFAPISREFRTWKRYKGGRAADLWIYNFTKGTSERITDFKGTDQIPSWYKDKIYFASDRDLTLNIYSFDTNTKETKQLTHHSEFDVMWPSGDNGQIAYENGGQLYKLNLETGKEERIVVNINFDNPNILPYYKNVKDDIHSSAISPNGKRALFDARGDIFSVPAKNGEIINLTNSSGVREIYPSWSPNGKYISYVSDQTGEYEIYLLENKKGAQPRQLTKGSSAWKYQPVWSANNKFMVFSDRTLQLKYVDVATGAETVIDKAVASEINHYNISPDSKWITYTKEAGNGNFAVWVYNIDNKTTKKITDDQFSDESPVFSTDGNYIFFTSNRDFNLDFSSFEFTYLYNNATRIYALALTKDSPKLRIDKVDTEEVAVATVENTKKSKKSKKDKTTDDNSVKIDFNGIEGRIMAFPMPASNYGGVEAIDGGILYVNEDGVQRYTIASEDNETIAEGVHNFTIAADGKNMLFSSRGDFAITPVAPNQKISNGKLDLSTLEMKINPREEWNQIYIDGWRIFRDYYYVSNIHNVDWKGIKAKYSKLLPYVSHRADLDYIIGEIISETNTGHAYDNYGDFEKVKRIETGLLGAILSADKENGRYQIAKIYKGENWNPERFSPLTEQGVNVKEGDYLISINGNNITTNENPYKFLENTVGKNVEITVNNKPSADGARTYRIKPIKSELELLYIDWVDARRAIVDKLSGGKIGYIHTPNTAVEGNRELFRGMYTYHNKKALVIDDRYNGGGFIPASMVELLNRKTLSYWHRNKIEPFKTPAIAHDGPKAMLVNGYSSSGGDCFPYYFRKMGLGKIYGTRTWGGLVGMSGNASLVDGGYIAVPRFGIYDESGEWIIEGVGVYPDIEVIDAPHLVAKGIDPSLEKAVKDLLKELETNTYQAPKAPAEPDRSKWIEVDVK